MKLSDIENASHLCRYEGNYQNGPNHKLMVQSVPELLERIKKYQALLSDAAVNLDLCIEWMLNDPESWSDDPDFDGLEELSDQLAQASKED